MKLLTKKNFLFSLKKYALFMYLLLSLALLCFVLAVTIYWMFHEKNIIFDLLAGITLFYPIILLSYKSITLEMLKNRVKEFLGSIPIVFLKTMLLLLISYNLIPLFFYFLAGLFAENSIITLANNTRLVSILTWIPASMFFWHQSLAKFYKNS